MRFGDTQLTTTAPLRGFFWISSNFTSRNLACTSYTTAVLLQQNKEKEDVQTPNFKILHAYVNTTESPDRRRLPAAYLVSVSGVESLNVPAVPKSLLPNNRISKMHFTIHRKSVRENERGGEGGAFFGIRGEIVSIKKRKKN